MRVESPVPGTLLRALVGEGAARLLACQVVGAAEETRRAHGLGPDATRLAAQGLVATVLLSAYVKGEERLSLQLQGSRPRLAFWSDVDAEGHVRARLTPPDLRLGEGAPLEGMLLALKSVRGREIYRGHTLVEGEPLEAALLRHLALSEQRAPLLRIAVRLDDAGRVVAAGGVLLERLPEERDRPSLDPEAFEARYGALRRGDAEAILAGLPEGRLGEDPLDVLEERPVQWQCRCSREKVEATLAGLGPEALREMIEEDDGAEVTCHFCNRTRQVSAERLRELLALQ